MTDRENGFYDGILAALAVVAAHDQPTIAQEIVNTIDRAALFNRADDYDRKNLKLLSIRALKGSHDRPS